MKIQSSNEHNRTLIVTEIPVSHKHDLDTLTITISYTDQDGRTRLDKALALDGRVIPEIIRAVNFAHTQRNFE